MVDARALADALDEVDPSHYRVVLLPDFAIDHLMYWDCAADAADALRSVRAGNNVDVHVKRQVLRAGGGAANTARALARFGVRAALIARTDAVGRRFLDETLAGDGVDVTHVRADGHLRVTGALECGDASVMLESPGDAAEFGPERLRDAENALVDGADAVYVGDWSNPRAAELAATVWARAKAAGARTFTDAAGGLRSRASRERRRGALGNPHLDVVSVNAQELIALAESDGDADDPDAVRDAGLRVSGTLDARVDLHAVPEAVSFQAGRIVGRAPAVDTSVRQATGAGDSWNAAVLLGDLLGLDADARLLFANAVVALYLASENARPPTLDAVRERLTGEPAAEQRHAERNV